MSDVPETQVLEVVFHDATGDQPARLTRWMAAGWVGRAKLRVEASGAWAVAEHRSWAAPGDPHWRWPWE